MALSIDGLVTGIDTTSIIEGMLQIQKSRADSIQAQIDKVNTERTAFISYEAQLLALQSSLRPLSRTANNAFKQKAVTVSDVESLTATASNQAVRGSYSLRVETLATNHQIASQSFSDPEQAIATGTFSVSVGGVATSVTITSANDTMQGLVEAINSASEDVTAAIVATGSSAAPSYRMLLSSNVSGAAGEITVVNGLTTLTGNAVRPAFNDSYIGLATSSTNNLGTSALTSNSGVQNYTGGVDDTFSFTVATGGTVGTTDGITLNYTNLTGSKTGTITLNSGEAGTNKVVVDGLQVALSAGSLNTGDTFSVKVYAVQPPIQAARDAVVAFGSGDQAIRLTSNTNTIQNGLPGITLNLLKADPDKSIQLDVGHDTTAIVESVQEFAATYNQYIDFVEEQTRYTVETDAASPLTGNRTILGIGARLRSEFLRSVPGVNDQVDSLNEMGFSFDASQKLVFNPDRLTAILNGEVDGVTPQDLQRLFAFDGATTNPGITFASSSNRTLTRTIGQDGQPVQVQVRVTGAATRGTITGTNIGSPLVVTNSNNTIQLKINAFETKTLTLASGTYSREEIVAEINRKIDSEFEGQFATASVSGTAIQLQNAEYGSSGRLQIEGGSALATLGWSAGGAVTGLDVQGQFVVLDANGAVLATEAATGRGQRLTGQSASQEREQSNVRLITADLQVLVTLGANDIAAETDATITLTQGVGHRLQNLLAETFDNRIKNAKAAYEERTTSLDESLKRVNDVFELRKEALLKQFTALEQSVNSFNSVGSLITSQLSSIRFR